MANIFLVQRLLHLFSDPLFILVQMNAANFMLQATIIHGTTLYVDAHIGSGSLAVPGPLLRFILMAIFANCIQCSNSLYCSFMLLHIWVAKKISIERLCLVIIF